MSVLNLNKVILAGRLTTDPELKQTSSGVSTTSFHIAVNRLYERDGQREADFITIVAWRQTAEFICKYFKKGSAICLSGAIQTRSWTDQQGGKRYATEIIAEEAMFVDGKNDVQSENSAQSAYIQTSAIPTAAATVTPKFEEIKTDDDLPF